MADLKKVACAEVDKMAAELNELSQKIWARPELNFEEHYAHQVLTDFLEARGFNVERRYKLETAFRATWGGETTGLPNVAILCEYDALPEIGHACGHNLIAELGVAAGLGVKAAMQAAGRPLGKLTVLGTPAEEGGGGKVKLIDQQAFDDVDAALMAHPAPFHDTRPAILAYVGYAVCFHSVLTVLGSPAEEGGGGKVKMIEAGVFDDVDVAMMAHPAPFHDTRIVMLARLR
nr:hypothetical protein BaRGS_012831 [Batillaria attramentaria]